MRRGARSQQGENLEPDPCLPRAAMCVDPTKEMRVEEEVVLLRGPTREVEGPTCAGYLLCPGVCSVLS